MLGNTILGDKMIKILIIALILYSGKHFGSSLNNPNFKDIIIGWILLIPAIVLLFTIA